jgi:hypothetical protein
MDKIDVIVQESEKAFLQERARADRIFGAAEKIVGAVAVVIGFQLIRMDQLTLSGSWPQALHGWLAIGALLELGISLTFAFLSMQVQKYYSYPRGTTLIDELKDASITYEVARIKIARMYLSAYDANAHINDKRAKILSYSGAMLVVGLVFAVISYLIGKVI